MKVTISRYYTASGRCIQSLDYWNRDDDGKAVKNSTFTDFKTRNGRKVQDGGGVLPDIEISALRTNAMTQGLLDSNVIFDFATQYYYQNKLNAPSEFDFTDNNFEAFKTYVNQSSFSFETKTEKALKEAMTPEEKAIYGAEVEEGFKNLLVQINKSKLTALDKYKNELQKNLEDEIIKRYFYREGLYDYYLGHDDAILAATALLADTSKYKDVLK